MYDNTQHYISQRRGKVYLRIGKNKYSVMTSVMTSVRCVRCNHAFSTTPNGHHATHTATPRAEASGPRGAARLVADVRGSPVAVARTHHAQGIISRANAPQHAQEPTT